jgi:hypothetical protein
VTGVAWLSSARAVRCPVQSVNERNPYPVLDMSQETASVKGEEGGDDAKSAWPLRLGLHTHYNGKQQWVAKPRGEANPSKPSPSSDWRLQLASMKSESLVTASQPYGREYVLGSCTHRPSNHESRGRPKGYFLCITTANSVIRVKS